MVPVAVPFVVPTDRVLAVQSAHVTCAPAGAAAIRARPSSAPADAAAAAPDLRLMDKRLLLSDPRRGRAALRASRRRRSPAFPRPLSGGRVDALIQVRGG